MNPYAERLDEELTSTSLKYNEASVKMVNQSRVMSSRDKTNTLKTKQNEGMDQFAVQSIAILVLIGLFLCAYMIYSGL